MGIIVKSVALAVFPHPEARTTGSASVTDEQERSVDTMDEQEKRETAEAEKQYSEAGKKHTEAEKLYAEAERQHNEAEDQYTAAEKQYTDTLEASKQAGVKRREEAEQRRAAEEEAEQQQANEAAKQFADAVRASYQAVAKRGVEAQALNAQLTQQFFTDVINNLRTQTEDTRQMTQQLADQQRRTQEAGQALTQESAGVYMDFVNSIFSFYQGSVQEEEKGAEAAERDTKETDTSTVGERVESQEVGGGLPIEDYDSLGVKKISERLEELSDEEVEQLRRYETANKNRSTLLVRFDARLGASST